MARRASHQTVAVLIALARERRAWRYGYELGQELELKAGTLYPILMRLCDRGLLEAAWETDRPRGRPPRHLYRITGAGERVAVEAQATLAAEPRALRSARRRQSALGATS